MYVAGNTIQNCESELSAKQWFDKGVSYEVIGEVGESHSCYKEAYRLDPQNAYYMYCYCKSKNVYGDLVSKMDEYYNCYSHVYEWEDADIRQNAYSVFIGELYRKNWERCEYALKYLDGIPEIDWIEMICRFVEKDEYELVERLFKYDTRKIIDFFKQERKSRTRMREEYSVYDLWYLGEVPTKLNWKKIENNPNTDLQMINLINKYYELPEEILLEVNPIKRRLKKWKCPVCGRKLNLFKYCGAMEIPGCRRSLDPMHVGCSAFFW